MYAHYDAVVCNADIICTDCALAHAEDEFELSKADSAEIKKQYDAMRLENDSDDAEYSEYEIDELEEIARGVRLNQRIEEYLNYDLEYAGSKKYLPVDHEGNTITGIVEDQSDDLHNNNCGICYKVLCSNMRDDGHCYQCSKEDFMGMGNSDKDIPWAVIVLENDFDPLATPQIGKVYCDDDALEYLGARVVDDAVHQRMEEWVEKIIIPAPSYSHGLFDTEPLQDTVYPRYIALQKNDPRLHGLECSECTGSLCAIKQCRCYDASEDELQAMRNLIQFSLRKEHGRIICTKSDSWGRIIEEFVPCVVLPEKLLAQVE